MNSSKFFFAVYPYIALTVFVIGSWIRYDREQYTWKTDSTQLLSKGGMVFASNFFHIGVLAIFAGHFAGLVLPHSFWLALGVSDMQHQWLAIIAGSVFGSMMLLGGLALWFRRLTNARVRAAGRSSDMFILTWPVLRSTRFATDNRLHRQSPGGYPCLISKPDQFHSTKRGIPQLCGFHFPTPPGVHRWDSRAEPTLI